jgi:hypothetical protein
MFSDVVTIAGMFIHHVCFWLKKGTPPASHEQLIADGRSLLSKIPGVRQLWMGKPIESPREVVDGSYDVGLCVILDDDAGHDVYQHHPLHNDFIARNKAHWEKVQVRDFLG